MGFEVLTAVKMSMLVFRSEDGSSMFLCIYLQVQTALQPRRLTLTFADFSLLLISSFGTGLIMTSCYFCQVSGPSVDCCTQLPQ
jgi:hypothetical protein